MFFENGMLYPMVLILVLSRFLPPREFPLTLSTYSDKLIFLFLGRLDTQKSLMFDSGICNSSTCWFRRDSCSCWSL